MLIVTLDLDWAPEPAIEETLDFLQERNITPTVFVTHRSPRVEASLSELEVGLHPFFDPLSSHGATIEEVVETIFSLPHNIPAYRCHRFGTCNTSKQAMAEGGMKIVSNVCTDLETIPPFRDRFGLIEVPIFLEDGGYLWNKHPLELSDALKQKLQPSAPQVLLIHPMHFAINTPSFSYMRQIKKSLSREQWRQLSKKDLEQLRYKGKGIRQLLIELLDFSSDTESLCRSIAKSP